MSLSLQHILSLPPHLRVQTFHQLLRSQSIAQPKVTLDRSFTTTIRRRATTSPKSSLKKSKVASPHVQPRALPTTPTTPLSRAQQPIRYANSLLRINSKVEELLLYRSPSHTSFAVSSYIYGALFMLGAYNMTKFMLYGMNPDKTKQPTIWFKLLVGGPAIVMAAVGTTFLIAPGRLIKSISLVRKEVAAGVYAPMLSFRARVLPFWKTETYEYGIGEVLMDKRIAGASLNYQNVPLERASEFSAVDASPKPKPPLSQQLLAPFRLFNAAIMNFWPSLKRDTARMFVRNGMTYMRLGDNGNFKLDIHDCKILDHGRPLEFMVTSDVNLRGGLLQWVQSALYSSGQR